MSPSPPKHQDLMYCMFIIKRRQKLRLKQLAAATGQNQSYLVRQALNQYLNSMEGQIKEASSELEIGSGLHRIQP